MDYKILEQKTLTKQDKHAIFCQEEKIMYHIKNLYSEKLPGSPGKSYGGWITAVHGGGIKIAPKTIATQDCDTIYSEKSPEIFRTFALF